MSKNRGKCVFNTDLAKKYPFIKKDLKKSESDVKCSSGADFSIANKGKYDIEQHLASTKHQDAMKAAANHTLFKECLRKILIINYKLQQNVEWN